MVSKAPPGLTRRHKTKQPSGIMRLDVNKLLGSCGQECSGSATLLAQHERSVCDRADLFGAVVTLACHLLTAGTCSQLAPVTCTRAHLTPSQLPIGSTWTHVSASQRALRLCETVSRCMLRPMLVNVWHLQTVAARAPHARASSRGNLCCSEATYVGLARQRV